MPEISVIIPVYNASKYLAECLGSVLAQTFQDVEIICINDGSTDKSLEILKQFAAEDARIVIIDQPNKGVSAARNAGIVSAKGKYIAFVDSDDTVDKDFFARLFQAAEDHQADVVFSGCLSGTSAFQLNKIYTHNEVVEHILPLYFKEDGYNAVWGKLYSTKIIRSNNIIFPIGKTHGEDAVFNIHFLMHASNLYALDYSGYQYRETVGSATRNALKFNYLKNAAETFAKDWSVVLGDIISSDAMHSLKKERFINNIISQIYIYANPENGMSCKLRIAMISEIVNNQLVIGLFGEDNSKIVSGFNRYKLAVFQAIRKKSVFTLYLLAMYSYYRNK